MRIWKFGAIGFLAILLIGMGIAYQAWRMRAPDDRVGDLTQQFMVNDSVRFFVVGDTGSGDSSQMMVADAMERRCETGVVHGIVLLGDNFYMDGVSSIHDPQWEEKVWGPYGRPCLSRLPIFAVLGNHDYKGNPGVQIQYSEINPRWYMPNRFYEVRFGQLVKLVVTDTNVMDKCWNAGVCAMDFLQQAVQDSSTKWILVAGHHPVSSASVRSKNYSNPLQGRLLRGIICDRADAYLAGHAHHLEHRRLPGCDMDMIISGGGGASQYPVHEGQQESLFARSTLGFVDLQVSPEKLVFQFVNQDGQVLYENTRSQ